MLASVPRRYAGAATCVRVMRAQPASELLDLSVGVGQPLAKVVVILAESLHFGEESPAFFK